MLYYFIIEQFLDLFVILQINFRFSSSKTNDQDTSPRFPTHLTCPDDVVSDVSVMLYVHSCDTCDIITWPDSNLTQSETCCLLRQDNHLHMSSIPT